MPECPSEEEAMESSTCGDPNIGGGPPKPQGAIAALNRELAEDSEPGPEEAPSESASP